MMTTVVLISATVLAIIVTALAVLLCAAAARADRRLQHALLEALGWRSSEWSLLDEAPHVSSYRERPAG
jgi:hypothetical protein